MNKYKLRKFFKPVYPILDILLSPFTFLASLLLFGIRKMRIVNMPVSKWIFKKVGVFPITNHYYEPLFDDRLLKQSLDRDRFLPGIQWNDKIQLDLLGNFHFQFELSAIPFKKTEDALSFYYNNPSLRPGDAEYLYCMVRTFMPSKIIEIGSGYSTLLIQKAISDIRIDKPEFQTDHICVEPYEMPWLEKTGARIIRELVEDLKPDLFKSLGENDMLFIDSSHMVRPQGDVLFEFLELLPVLQKGVIVHVHDIYSPRDYPKELLVDDVMFWNEQYILESFLSCNDSFEIIGALHYLKAHYPEEVFSKLPVLGKMRDEVPGSFWMKKVR
ncbi:MAG TPA: class I SAM-dependent methyltransferase [Puia sp.]